MTDLVLNKRKGNNPIFAIQCFFKGIRFLGRPGIRQYIIFPILINLVLYFTAFTVGSYYFSDLIDQFIPSWLDWLSWVLWPLFYISLMTISFFTFTLFANLIASPFYGKLSAKTLSIISGNPEQIDEQKMVRVIYAEIKRMVYLFSWAVPLLILLIIPGLNLLAPFLWLLFGAWGMVLEFSAYPLENEGVLFSDQRQLFKSIRIGVLCYGGLVLLLLSIPVLNILVPPAAVIGATIFVDGVKNQLS